MTKNSGVIVDMIGRQDVTNSGAIDLNSLLNDPNYLNDLEINLESIQNLVVRRKRFVRKGNLNFANEDLLEEWAIYPNFEISDLGQHINACLVPVLKWDGVDIFTQEDERFEDEINLPVFGTIVISEPLTESITIFIENVFSEYLPSDPQASSFFDFSTPIDPFDDLTIDAGTESIDYLLLTTELDFQEEGDEGTGFQFDIVNAGNSGAVVEFNGDLFDIKIKEMTTSISDLNPSIDILISPTLVNTHLTLESNDSQLSFESLTIVGLDSKASRVEKLNGGNRVTVNLSSFHSRGLHVLNIKTNKGTITKKIFKF